MLYIYIKKWLEQEIKPLRGRDLSNFKILLFSDMREAHSEAVRDICAEYGVLRQTTAGYTPERYGRDILGGLAKNGDVYLQSSTTCQTHTG